MIHLVSLLSGSLHGFRIRKFFPIFVDLQWLRAGYAVLAFGFPKYAMIEVGFAMRGHRKRLQCYRPKFWVRKNKSTKPGKRDACNISRSKSKIRHKIRDCTTEAGGEREKIVGRLSGIVKVNLAFAIRGREWKGGWRRKEKRRGKSWNRSNRKLIWIP